jgi:hypothetical protein
MMLPAREKRTFSSVLQGNDQSVELVVKPQPARFVLNVRSCSHVETSPVKIGKTVFGVEKTKKNEQPLAIRPARLVDDQYKKRPALRNRAYVITTL